MLKQGREKVKGEAGAALLFRDLTGSKSVYEKKESSPGIKEMPQGTDHL